MIAILKITSLLKEVTFSGIQTLGVKLIATVRGAVLQARAYDSVQVVVHGSQLMQWSPQ